MTNGTGNFVNLDIYSLKWTFYRFIIVSISNTRWLNANKLLYTVSFCILTVRSTFVLYGFLYEWRKLAHMSLWLLDIWLYRFWGKELCKQSHYSGHLLIFLWILPIQLSFLWIQNKKWKYMSVRLHFYLIYNEYV